MAALDPDLSLTLLYARSRCDEAAVDCLGGRLAALLAAMAAGEDRPLSALSPLTPAEAAQIAARAAGGSERRPEGRRDYSPPVTEIERDLAAIWGEVLAVRGVGLEDGFFDLGGHSLLANRLLLRVRAAFGVDLPLAGLLDDPTLGGMVVAVTASLVARTEERELDELLDELDGLNEEEAERLLAGGREAGS
jgi:non-ribosomal peptide synthetase component F